MGGGEGGGEGREPGGPPTDVFSPHPLRVPIVGGTAGLGTSTVFVTGSVLPQTLCPDVGLLSK